MIGRLHTLTRAVGVLAVLAATGTVLAATPQTRTVISEDTTRSSVGGPGSTTAADEIGPVSFRLPQTAAATTASQDPQVAQATGPQVFTVQIPALNLDAPVFSVGANGGTMDIPADEDRLGWYRDSGREGDLVGNIIVAGHVASNSGDPGAFSNLRTLKVGDKVKITSGGKTTSWQVTGSFTQSREKTLPASMFTTDGPVQLRLVTCTNKITYPNGSYHYRDNLVVTAERLP